MKKIKLNGKLSLNKKHISSLNQDEMNDVNGGGLIIVVRSRDIRCRTKIFCPTVPPTIVHITRMERVCDTHTAPTIGHSIGHFCPG